MNISTLPYYRFICLGLLILLGAIWGTGYAIARFAMTHEVPALGYSFWQSFGPAVLLSLPLLKRESTIKIATSISLCRFYFVAGLIGIAIPNTVMYMASAHIPASLLVVVINTVPLFAYPIALLSKTELFTWQRLLSLCISCIGLGLVLLPNASQQSHYTLNWLILALITPLSFALCATYIAKYCPSDLSPLALSRGMLISSSILLLPIVLYNDAMYFFHFPFNTNDYIIFLEIILSTMGYILFFILITLAGPVFYSLIDGTVVLTGIFWGVTLFNESISFKTKIAVLLILSGLALATKYQTKQRNNSMATNNRDANDIEDTAISIHF